MSDNENVYPKMIYPKGIKVKPLFYVIVNDEEEEKKIMESYDKPKPKKQFTPKPSTK